MIKKTFRQMLVTQILSAMTVLICMMIDNIMIGRFLGVDSVSAYGLASPVLLIFAAFGSMLTAGIQVMCGKTMGAGDMDGTNACYSAAVTLAVSVSVAGLILVIAFTGPLSTLLGAGVPSPDNDVFFLTKDYLRGFIIGAPAFISAQIMVPFMQISGNRMRLVVAVAFMTVFNILFDILNVFVFHGGMFGMGLASSLSYYVAFSIGVVYFLKRDCIFKLRTKAVTPRLCGELLKYGIPTVINQVSVVLLVFVLNKILLGLGGNLAVAAYSVISTIGSLCYCFGSGIGSVSLLLASIFRSDEDRTALRSLMRTMISHAAVIDSAVIIVIQLAATFLVGLFLPGNPETKELAARGLRLFSLSLLSCAMNTTLKNYFNGVGHTRFTEIISFIQNFLFTTIFAFILSRSMGTDGVWIAYVCGETLTLLIIAVVVWIRNGRISFSADAFSLLPRDFGVQEKDCMEMTIRSAQEAAVASRSAFEFCKTHGENNRNSMLISLCVEEMVNNIVQHGFKRDKKDHSVDIRILFKEDSRIIRIRDNCVNFDPTKYVELHRTDDPVAHIGLRMVMNMVKSANYVNSLGLNNLTLTL
jgi:putative MATE family efflux protein